MTADRRCRVSWISSIENEGTWLHIIKAIHLAHTTSIYRMLLICWPKLSQTNNGYWTALASTYSKIGNSSVKLIGIFFFFFCLSLQSARYILDCTMKHLKVVKMHTSALSSSNSRHPMPSKRTRSIHPLQTTQTPFRINWDFKWTCNR